MAELLDVIKGSPDADVLTGTELFQIVQKGSLRKIDATTLRSGVLKGDKGDTGPQGLKGDKGDVGAQGATGASGGMTNPMTTLGDVIVGGASGTPVRLPIASNGQVLTVSAGAPIWSGNDLMRTIATHISANTDPIDFVDTSIPNMVILGYYGSQNANAWKSATNATYTTPTGKTLIPYYFTLQGDSANRRVQVYNNTDATTYISYTTFNGMFLNSWGGDAATPSTFNPVLPANKKITLQIWNPDTTKRAMGGVAVFLLV